MPLPTHQYTREFDTSVHQEVGRLEHRRQNWGNNEGSACNPGLLVVAGGREQVPAGEVVQAVPAPSHSSVWGSRRHWQWSLRPSPQLPATLAVYLPRSVQWWSLATLGTGDMLTCSCLSPTFPLSYGSTAFDVRNPRCSGRAHHPCAPGNNSATGAAGRHQKPLEAKEAIKRARGQHLWQKRWRMQSVASNSEAVQ